MIQRCSIPRDSSCSFLSSEEGEHNRRVVVLQQHLQLGLNSIDFPDTIPVYSINAYMIHFFVYFNLQTVALDVMQRKEFGKNWFQRGTTLLI